MATTEKVKETQIEEEEMVDIYIPKERGDERDSIYVSINDRTFQVQIGKRVKVPKCVAEVIEYSESRRDIAEAYVESVAKNKTNS